LNWVGPSRCQISFRCVDHGTPKNPAGRAGLGFYTFSSVPNFFAFSSSSEDASVAFVLL
jgi:hypothetical protein